jgi:hypothetical protein
LFFFADVYYDTDDEEDECNLAYKIDTLQKCNPQCASPKFREFSLTQAMTPLEQSIADDIHFSASIFDFEIAESEKESDKKPAARRTPLTSIDVNVPVQNRSCNNNHRDSVASSVGVASSNSNRLANTVDSTHRVALNNNFQSRHDHRDHQTPRRGGTNRRHSRHHRDQPSTRNDHRDHRNVRFVDSRSRSPASAVSRPRYNPYTGRLLDMDARISHHETPSYRRHRDNDYPSSMEFSAPQYLRPLPPPSFYDDRRRGSRQVDDRRVTTYHHGEYHDTYSQGHFRGGHPHPRYF